MQIAQNHHFAGIHHRPHGHRCSGQFPTGGAVRPDALLVLASMLGRSERLGAHWGELSKPLQGQAPPLPSTEMQPGQSLQNGRTSVSVDGQGNLSASTAPAQGLPAACGGGSGQPQGGCQRPDFGEFMAGFAAGFQSGAAGLWAAGSMFDGAGSGFDSGTSSCSGSGAPSAQQGGQAGPAGLRLEGGQIVLPNGKKVPFGNTGVIIEMPDGTQVAAGRNSDTDTKNCRWVTAGPGEQIPTSPPGKCNLFKLDANGNLTQTGVK